MELYLITSLMIRSLCLDMVERILVFWSWIKYPTQWLACPENQDGCADGVP
jgi:hypothetical protein